MDKPGSRPDESRPRAQESGPRAYGPGARADQPGACADQSGAKLARSLASLLTRGTWLASIVIAVGLLVGWSGEIATSAGIITAGIALVVLLPVIRVGAVLAHFRAVGERKFVVGGALVLVIIAASVIAGL